MRYRGNPFKGQTVPVTNPKTGAITQASIFVAVLGASNYTYADASWKQDLACWIRSHVRALEFLGGSPAVPPFSSNSYLE